MDLCMILGPKVGVLPSFVAKIVGNNYCTDTSVHNVHVRNWISGCIIICYTFEGPVCYTRLSSAGTCMCEVSNSCMTVNVHFWLNQGLLVEIEWQFFNSQSSLAIVHKIVAKHTTLFLGLHTRMYVRLASPGPTTPPPPSVY